MQLRRAKPTHVQSSTMPPMASGEPRVARAWAGQPHVGVQEAARASGRRVRHHDHRRLRRRPCRGRDGGRRHRRHRPLSDCDRFAAFNGTAAIEVSSGGSKLRRLWGTARSTVQSTWPPSPSSGSGTAPGVAATVATPKRHPLSVADKRSRRITHGVGGRATSHRPIE